MNQCIWRQVVRHPKGSLLNYLQDGESFLTFTLQAESLLQVLFTNQIRFNPFVISIGKRGHERIGCQTPFLDKKPTLSFTGNISLILFPQFALLRKERMTVFIFYRI